MVRRFDGFDNTLVGALSDLRQARTAVSAVLNPTGLEARALLLLEADRWIRSLQIRLDILLHHTTPGRPPDDNDIWKAVMQLAHELDTLYETLNLKQVEEQQSKSRLRSSYLTIESLRQSDYETLSVQVLQEPLTASNVEAVLSGISTLYTKCYLAASGELQDFMLYSQTNDKSIERRANLIISKLTYNSPLGFEFKLDLSLESVAEALRKAIDAVYQTKQRHHALELSNASLEEDIRVKQEELHIRELEVASKVASEEQDRGIAAAREELEKQRILLALERDRVALARERIELQMDSADWAFDTAFKMANIMRPNADEATKLMIAQGLVPQLLQLVNTEGLRLPPVEQPKEDDSGTAD